MILRSITGHNHVQKKVIQGLGLIIQDVSFSSRCLSLQHFCSTSQHFLHSQQFTQRNNAILRHSCVRLCHSSTTHAHIYGRHWVPKTDSEKGKLVYTGNLATNMRNLKMFSFSTSFLTLCFQPLVLSGEQSVLAKTTLVGMLAFFMVLNPILIQLLVKRYTLYMYYNEQTKTFTATTMTLFLGRKDIIFKREDVTENSSASMFTFLKVLGKPLFLDPSQFTDMRAYIQLMGYNKPIDLSSLSNTDSEMKKYNLHEKYKGIEIPELDQDLNEQDVPKNEQIEQDSMSEKKSGKL